MSLILYHDEEQKLLADKSRERQQRKCTDLILTEVRRFEKFYPAEE